MPEPNEKLRQARNQKMWSQERAAAEIKIDRKTYIRWEKGQHIPQPRTLELACDVFGMTAEELGFSDNSLQKSKDLEVTPEPEDAVSLSPDSSEGGLMDWVTWLGVKLAHVIIMIGMWQGRTTFYDEVQVMVDQEIKMIDHELQQHWGLEQQAISRRQALVTLAALPTAWSTRLMTDAAKEEFLPRCAASITVCWHLMKEKGFVHVGGILADFVPSLATIALQPSKFQQGAARIAVQASIIRGILAMHQLHFTEREAHCQEAVRFATISKDRILHAAALMYLGYTYSHCYFPRQPQKAIPIFHQALHVLGNETSLLRSDILMGLAEACAHCKEEKEALDYIGLTQEHFPTYPELDPSFIYADCGLNTLYQWEGKMYLQLVEHFPDAGYQQKAADSLMKSIGVDSISARSASETAIYRADAARVLGDLDIYTKALREAIQMATNVGSKRRYQDAVQVYQRTPEKWMRESKMQALAKDMFRQVAVKKG